MNGATDYLPIMADCHRALGQPEQALKLAKSPAVAHFSSSAKAEMTLVEAGARRDLGHGRALRQLQRLFGLAERTMAVGHDREVIGGAVHPFGRRAARPGPPA